MMLKKQKVLSGVPVLLMLLGILHLATVNNAYARTIGDITVPDTLSIAGKKLQLNGAGYRTKFVFKLYVGALYTEEKADTRDAVQAMNGPKRVLMHMIYDEISQKKMAGAWREGFEENTSDAQMHKLQERLQAFIKLFPDLKEGDIVYLDYIPGTGTRVIINEQLKGTIAGEDFYHALLDVWLGDEPADDDLKAAMLGREDD